jgi:hypothetical protein
MVAVKFYFDGPVRFTTERKGCSLSVTGWELLCRIVGLQSIVRILDIGMELTKHPGNLYEQELKIQFEKMR